MAARVLSRVSAITLGLLGAGCDFPAPEACALACGPAGECPGTFVCQPETQQCAPRDRTEPCTSSQQLPDTPSDTSDAGDPPPPAQGHDAGGTQVPPDPPSRALAVEMSAASVCGGAELELSAQGGEGPYRWRVLGAPAGVHLSAESGSVVELSTAAETSGLVLVELRDGTGQRVASQAVPVYPRPVIDSLTLPTLCAGAGYLARLEAWGGDDESYAWSARTLSGAGDDAEAASLDALGLELDGPLVTGLGADGLEAIGAVRLELGLRDAHCDAEPVEVELELAAEDSDACPSIVVAGWGGESLPAPCRGNQYSEALTVEGGEAPFTWTKLSSPPGLDFDVESGIVQGRVEQDGVLAVAVTDAAGRSVAARYELQPRDSCWLAYVAGGVAPSRLTLVDSHLLERQPDDARRVLPSAASTEAVSDFRFSPDGRFIAYRLGTAPDAQRLELSRLSDGATTALDLTGSVTDYAWSGDAAFLFATTGSAGQVLLHALDVSASRSAPGPQLGGVRRLPARSVPDPGGALAAHGARQLAYLTADAASPQRLRLVTSGVDGSRLATPSVRSELDFSSSARLIGARAGAVVSDPEATSSAFFAGDGRPPGTRSEVLPSSSGELVARASGGTLSIFDATGSDPGPALVSAGGCTRLLAWSTSGDCLVCTSEPPAGAGLSFFSLGVDAPSDLSAAGQVAVDSVGALGFRRAFSPSRRWFAIAGSDSLTLWSLAAASPRPWITVANAELGAPASTLVFSPDESRLLVGGGNRLAWLELSLPEAGLRDISASAALDEVCSERPSDGVEQWCGSDIGPSLPRWSSGSDLVAFRSTLGTLRVVDIAGDSTLTPDDDCEEACSSAASARFQP